MWGCVRLGLVRWIVKKTRVEHPTAPEFKCPWRFVDLIGKVRTLKRGRNTMIHSRIYCGLLLLFVSIYKYQVSFLFEQNWMILMWRTICLTNWKISDRRVLSEWVDFCCNFPEINKVGFKGAVNLLTDLTYHYFI